MPNVDIHLHIRKRYIFFVVCLLTLTAIQLTFPEVLNFFKPPPPRPVNRHATVLTRNLFTNLRLAASSGLTMLGMDEATLQGEFARSSACGAANTTKLNGYDSDIRAICADGPGIYGFDLLKITGEWIDTEPYRSNPTFNNDSIHHARVATRQLVRSHIRSIHKRGGVSTIHWHMNNPIPEIPVSYNKGTLDEFWQVVPPRACWTHRYLWRAPNCGKAFHRFKAKIDDAISFFNSLSIEEVEGEDELDDLQVESTGILNAPDKNTSYTSKLEYVPVIVRMFHEQNGNWFWWCVPKDAHNDFNSVAFRRWQVAYRVIWSWLIKYHNKHGRNNVLWATAPNSDFLTRNSYLEYIPSPKEVDVLGFDAYGDFKRDYPRTEVRVVVRLAESLGKIPAATELGYNGGDRKAWPPDVWSSHLLGPALSERIAWILMWFNAPTAGKCTGTYWGPHIRHSNSNDFRGVCDRKDVIMEGEYDYFQRPLNDYNPSLRDNGDKCVEKRQHLCKRNGGRGFGRVWVCESGYFCADETPHSECKCRITDEPKAESGLDFCLWNDGCGFGFTWECSSQGSQAACAKTNDSYTQTCVSYCPNRPTCVTNNGRGETSLFPCPENDDHEDTEGDHICSRERIHPEWNATERSQHESFWEKINIFTSNAPKVGLCIVNDTDPPIASNGYPYCITNKGCGYGDKFSCGDGFFCAKSDLSFTQMCVASCPGTCPTPPLPCTSHRGRGNGPLVRCEHNLPLTKPGLCVQPSKSGWWGKQKSTTYDEAGECECRVYDQPLAKNGIPYCLSNKGCGFGWKRRCMKNKNVRSTIYQETGDLGVIGRFDIDDDEEDNICAYTDLTMKTPCVSVCF